MKIYTKEELRNITADASRWFSPSLLSLRVSDAAFVADGDEIYILVEGETWRAPDGRLVDLYNTHLTGELRWAEPSVQYRQRIRLEQAGQYHDGFRHLTPGGILAALHFEIVPSSMTLEEWKDAVESYKVRLNDLYDVPVEMLAEAAATSDGSGNFLEERGEPLPPEASAMYDMQRKGLLTIGASVAFDRKTRQYFNITEKGRQLMKAGVA